MSSNINDDLVRISESIGIKYILKGKEVSSAEVFSNSGMLPAIALRADQLSYLCLGYGIGIKIEKNEKANLKRIVKFDKDTPNILRYLCILDIIEELNKANNSKKIIILDELLYEFR